MELVDDFYFFDSYAIIKVLESNELYNKYTDACIITTKVNLFEVFYYILRTQEEEKAKIVLEKYSKFTTEFDKDIIAKAAIFRLKYKKRKLSMVDCISYILAKQLRIKFLTGDREFKDLENVEFVK